MFFLWRVLFAKYRPKLAKCYCGSCSTKRLSRIGGFHSVPSLKIIQTGERPSAQTQTHLPFRPLLWPSEIWWFADVFFAEMLFSNLNLSEPVKICNSQKPLSVSFPIFLALHLTIQKIAANIRDADSTKRQKRHSLSLKLTKKLPLFKSCSLSLPVSTSVSM